MQGQTVVPTGATSGIGEAAALALARAGARIVLVARNEQRAEATLKRLEAAAPRLGHRSHLADLMSMGDTRRVGGMIAASEPKIDVLINNAGALFAERRVTAEGLERTFALNHMAYFVLTAALIGNLRASAPARIVSTASDAHSGARLDFDDLQLARRYSAFKAYARSKLANILFTRELARRLAGSGVAANCFHPGFVASRFGDEAGGLIGWAMPFAKLAGLTPEKGAETLVYLASAPQVANASGAYFVKRRVAEPSPAARDDQAAKRLWRASESLAGPWP
ncbi:MAG: SDR family NAD(P)-dependent oxidoreductase [Hyphomicrobiales bacterium]|nr:SDR family NAD(P)-dependent oxidoreductase [Hyphomicrobiales bacterium]